MLSKNFVMMDAVAVGKTPIIQILASDWMRYTADYMMSTKVDFMVKSISVPDTNAIVDLFIFDIPGQEFLNHVSFREL